MQGESSWGGGRVGWWGGGPGPHSSPHHGAPPGHGMPAGHHGGHVDPQLHTDGAGGLGEGRLLSITLDHITIDLWLFKC
jgi:hypothetical protein